MLTPELFDCWEKNGFVKIPAFYSEAAVNDLQKWCDQLAAQPPEKGKAMFYYETSMNDRERILCRIENFIDYHPPFRELLTDERLLTTLQALIQEEPVLFKEKINFKLPVANGFAPHQDAPAFAMFHQQYHVTVLISIDATTLENGCLEVVRQCHQGLLPQEANGDIAMSFVEQAVWEPLTTRPGDMLIFNSFVPHRSGPNKTDKPRRALFATYNKASDMDRRKEYFTEKRKFFPPEYERENMVPSANNPFNLGNPIM